MNFDFSTDQKALRDQARKFLAEHASSVRVRRILDTDEPYDRCAPDKVGAQADSGVLSGGKVSLDAACTPWAPR